MNDDIEKTIDFIINNDSGLDKYKEIEKNIEKNFYNSLEKYYETNNIYTNNRFKKIVPSWYLNKFLEIEKNIILKKYIFTKK